MFKVYGGRFLKFNVKVLKCKGIKALSLGIEIIKV